MKNRLLMILIALDVFLFALLCLGNVRLGETASAAAWSLKLDDKWWGKFWVPVIDQILGRGHCKDAYEWQIGIYQ